MKLALLIGANPRLSSGGPWIKLHKGNWCINVSNVVDSKLCALHYATDISTAVPVSIPSSSFVGPCHVRIIFDERGTEPHISVFAELTDGAKH